MYRLRGVLLALLLLVHYHYIIRYRSNTYELGP